MSGPTNLMSSEAERRLLYALALMASQYLGEEHEGTEVLDHMCVGAGEAACKELEAYGLLKVQGRGATWTEAGENLLNSNPNLREPL